MIFFIFPVGGNTFVGTTMHVPSADLDFKGKAFFTDHSCMYGLIAVGSRHADVVLKTAGDKLPRVVHDTENSVTIGECFSDASDGDKIVYFVKRNVLTLHFGVDTVNPFDPALKRHGNVLFISEGFELFFNFLNKLFTSASSLFD